MASYNRVMLIGNLTRDIELRHTPGGTAVTDMGMAVNDRRKNAQGEWVDEVTYVDVTLWGRTAEVAGEYLRKGAPVFIEGRLKLDSWEAEGQKKYKLRVVGERLQLLGGRPEEGGRSDAPRSSGGNRQAVREEYDTSGDDFASNRRRDPQPGSGPPSNDSPSYDDSDIPF